tara:strand:+ start:329 stop:514 length:186 start_codon:yes stop_codon:yes gene_type:complete
MEEDTLQEFLEELTAKTDYIRDYGHSLKVNTEDKGELLCLVKMINEHLDRFSDIVEESYGL